MVIKNGSVLQNKLSEIAIVIVEIHPKVIYPIE